jgi:hypothetical protein
MGARGKGERNQIKLSEGAVRLEKVELNYRRSCSTHPEGREELPSCSTRPKGGGDESSVHG